MSAEPIARVIADLRSQRAVRPPPRVTSLDDDVCQRARELIADPVVVDATSIYHSLLERDEIAVYGDHPCIAPPFEESVVAYENEHGNVIATHLSIAEDASNADLARNGLPPFERWWQTDNEVEWDRVRWTVLGFVWLGGRGGDGRAFPTMGPVHGWAFAIYDDGAPADLHWMQVVPDYPLEHWDMAHLTVLGSLNFLNCRNVDIVEPVRPRAEARRIARTGVTVHTINVYPSGRATRSDTGAPLAGGVPLSSVRGHFATYGPEYGRGLLFGKYAGRFWIPQHARGSADAGRSVADYRLVPDGPASGPEEISG